MTWARVGTFGAVGQDKTSSSSIATDNVNSVGTAAVGSVVIVGIAKDNLQTTDGNTSEVTTVTDSKGNTYTPIREFCNGQGGAGAGAVISLWYSLLTTAINVGATDTITANFNGAITAKAIVADNFTIGAGATVSVAGNATDLANDAADPGSMTISGLTSGPYLFIRATALERPQTGWTPTTNYTQLTLKGTSGGSAVTNMEYDAEFRIFTGTGDTSDPTATAVDSASIYVALKEAVAAVSLPILVMAPPRS
jgi:hypothetical protein